MMTIVEFSKARIRKFLVEDTDLRKYVFESQGHRSGYDIKGHRFEGTRLWKGHGSECDVMIGHGSYISISDLTAVCTILCTRPRIDLYIYFILIAIILIL
jgi:hypothetical protein